ncbi:MAG: SAM-dependent methyltransferase [Verrucomicrobiales bacterium]|jgi:SAM-dependent methyltransferase
MENADKKTVQHFGEEWSAYDQREQSEDHERDFERYFHVFPWDRISEESTGFDMGCGSGRWAKFVAPRVGKLVCVDASDAALEVAKVNLEQADNVELIHASVSEAPIEPESMDFGYSLGVLHHIPDTAAGIRACAGFLKPGAPLLLYLYYAFDNRPFWFRWLWLLSNIFRIVICKLPAPLKRFVCTGIAVVVYWPLARMAKLFEKCGWRAKNWPLRAYRHRAFYTMRTDALDRFGTPLEQRFTRVQITRMLDEAGFENAEFSDKVPFWCAVAYRRSE